MTLLLQSTPFTYFTCNYWSFQVLLLLKKCSFDEKCYVFSKFCSNIKRFWSENQKFTGFDRKKSHHWLKIFFFLPCRKPFSDLYTFPYLNANWRTNRKNLGTFFFQFLLHIWWLIFQSFRTDVCRIFRIEHWQFLLHFSHDQNTFLWSHTRSLLTLHSSTSDAILSCAEKIYQAKMDDAREREREKSCRQDR